MHEIRINQHQCGKPTKTKQRERESNPRYRRVFFVSITFGLARYNIVNTRRQYHPHIKYYCCCFYLDLVTFSFAWLLLLLFPHSHLFLSLPLSIRLNILWFRLSVVTFMLLVFDSVDFSFCFFFEIWT